MFRKLMTAMFAALALGACNPLANLEVAEQRVESFERAYSSGNVDQLWRMTGKQFREETSKQEFADRNQILSTRLGGIKSSERTNFNVNTANGVTTTLVAMDTDFERGEGMQVFTFIGQAEDMKLVRWDVESPLLKVTIDDLKAVQE